MTLIVLWIVGAIFGASFGEILTVSVLLAALSFIGDVFILPKIGPVIAAISDFALAMAVIWIISANLFITPVPIETFAFISASLLTAGEIFFHMYMRAEFQKEEKKTKSKFMEQQLQTEFAEEMESNKNGDGKNK